MSTPAQAYDHVVTLVSGPLEPHTLQLAALPATGASFNAGALVTLNSTGKVIAGAGAADIAMWAINGTADYDVTNDGVAYGGGQNILSGYVSCYVATGGYELFTSEYDSTAAASLLPNTRLTPSAANAPTVTAAAAHYSLKNTVGVVSRGIITDQYGKGTLYFWPCYLPATKVS